MNIQCKKKKSDKINNKFAQVVRVLGPFKNMVMASWDCVHGSCL